MKRQLGAWLRENLPDFEDLGLRLDLALSRVVQRLDPKPPWHGWQDVGWIDEAHEWTAGRPFPMQDLKPYMDRIDEQVREVLKPVSFDGSKITVSEDLFKQPVNMLDEVKEAIAKASKIPPKIELKMTPEDVAKIREMFDVKIEPWQERWLTGIPIREICGKETDWPAMPCNLAPGHPGGCYPW